MPKLWKTSGRIGFWSSLCLMVLGTCVLSYLAWNHAAPLPKPTGNAPSVFDSLRRGEAEAGTIVASQSLLRNGSNSLAVRPASTYEEEGLALEEVQPSSEGDDIDQRIQQLLLQKPDFQPPVPAEEAKSEGGSVALIELTPTEQKLSSQVPSLCSDEDQWREHSVAKGETLGLIAQKYGVTTATIMKVNNIKNANRLAQGQTLIIPYSDELADQAIAEVKLRQAQAKAERERAEPVTWKDYQIQTGDSLWSIASKFDLSVDSILGSNNLKNPDVLKPGLTIKLPNQDGILVKVEKGTSLSGLAKKYDVTETAICMANNLKSGAKPAAGTELFLPGASVTVAAYRSASSSGGLSSKAPQVAKSAPLPVSKSKTFSWPLRGRINSPFGWRTHPVLRKRWFHTGIDIKGARGTPIHAARSGQVIFAGWMNGYGRVVVLRHDSHYTTLYAHAQRLLVRKGQQVNKGQTIALVGTSGRSTGPHLHFEVRYNNSPTNPMSYLR